MTGTNPKVLRLRLYLQSYVLRVTPHETHSCGHFPFPPCTLTRLLLQVDVTSELLTESVRTSLKASTPPVVSRGLNPTFSTRDMVSNQLGPTPDDPSPYWDPYYREKSNPLVSPPTTHSRETVVVTVVDPII